MFEPEEEPILSLYIGATKRNIGEDWLTMSRSVHEFLDSGISRHIRGNM